MEGKKVETIRLRVGMMDPLGKILPRGVKEELTAEITDQAATFRFKRGDSTRHFARVVMALEARKNKKDTIYLERFQKIVTKYPGKTKEEIRDLLLNQLKQMGLNARQR